MSFETSETWFQEGDKLSVDYVYLEGETRHSYFGFDMTCEVVTGEGNVVVQDKLTSLTPGAIVKIGREQGHHFKGNLGMLITYRPALW
jgi:hypothetical protein